ncbi:MAG: hypothetical protein WCK33_02750 [Phycisphaerae bacterium]
MKTTTILAAAALAALAFVGGCNKSSKGDMGAVGGQKCAEKACCGKCGGDKSKCDGSCKKKEGSMGTVGEKKDGCCPSQKKDASMGAVNGKSCEGAKAACPASGSGCSSKN